MVEGLLVDGLERGLLAVVKADAEFDLGDGAASEVANAATSVGASVTGVAVGRVVAAASLSVAVAGTSDDVALVVDRRNVSELRGDAEDSVEGISLCAGLRGGGRRSSASRLARVLGGLVGGARVRQGVADELGDDVDVLSGTVVEGLLVDGLERGLLAVVKADAEFDLGDGAAAEVTDASARVGSCSGLSAGGSGSVGRSYSDGDGGLDEFYQNK